MDGSSSHNVNPFQHAGQTVVERGGVTVDVTEVVLVAVHPDVEQRLAAGRAGSFEQAVAWNDSERRSERGRTQLTLRHVEAGAGQENEDDVTRASVRSVAGVGSFTV